jgi:protease-4
MSALVAIASFGANSRYFQKSGQVEERWHSLSKDAPSRVAIVDVIGAIMGGSGFARQQLDRIADDESVKAIVLRVDSPGGTVSGSDDIHHRLAAIVKKRDLKVVVSMGSIAASGGYYVAMANGGGEDVIFAEPATLTGSIGVIIPHYDFSKALRKIDIADDSITSGPLKEMLSPTKERAPELAERERKVLQSLVDDMFARFKEVVREGRPKLDAAAVDAVATGQVFTARQAQAAGLVDRIGFLEDAVDRAVELAGLTKRPPGWSAMSAPGASSTSSSGSTSPPAPRASRPGEPWPMPSSPGRCSMPSSNGPLPGLGTCAVGGRHWSAAAASPRRSPAPSPRSRHDPPA